MKRFLVLLLLVQGCPLFKEQPFHKVIILPETIIHIRNDCDGEMGWAKDNVVCVWGYKQNGIVIDYFVFGHEIAHRLHHVDNEIKNPDRIRNLMGD